MNKFSFLYLIFFYLIATVYTLYGDISTENQIIGAFSLIVFFGIPHGAIDNVIFLSSSKISALKFYIFYIFSILTYLTIWITFPKYAFIFFLIISAYHFGESQLVNYNISSFFKNTIYFIWGIALMSTLIFYNKIELLKLLGSFEDTAVFNNLMQLKIIETFFWVSNILLILFLCFLTKKEHILINDLTSEIFQIILIHLTFILFPIIVSFTLYFIFLHSIKVLTQEFTYLKKIAKDLSIFRFVQMLTPYTLISLAFFGIFLYFSNEQMINVSLLLLAIISFSVITLPHSIVMTIFYEKLKDNS